MLTLNNDNVFDGEGYFDADKIKPLSIETKMLSVGSRMQQFNLPDVSFTVSEDNTAVSNTTGTLVHLTLEDTPREWNIPQNTVTGIGTAFHYIYIKAQKIGSNASVFISTEQLQVANDPDWYYFEAGYLSSVIDDVRRIKTTYGFTQVSPSEISTGRIASPNGNSYIELLQDKININANVTFESNSPAFQQVSDSIEVGGRNLLKYSALFDKYSFGSDGGNNAPVIVEDLIDGDYMRHITNGNNIYWWVKSSETRLQLKSYTLSLEVKTDREWGFYFYPSESYSFYSNNPKSIQNTNDEWSKWSFTYTQTGVNTSEDFLFGFHSNTEGAKIEFRKLKLEKGNKATDWTPAPEDVQEGIDNAIQEAQNAAADALNALNTAQTTANKTNFLQTDIDGNVISTGTMQVGALNGANAGVTGVTDAGANSVRFFAGSDYAGKNTAPFRVLDDGSIIAENANIQGHIEALSGSFAGHVEASSGSFSGHVEALSGKFSGFTILDDKITGQIILADGTPYQTPVFVEIDPLNGVKAIINHNDGTKTISNLNANGYMVEKLSSTGSTIGHTRLSYGGVEVYQNSQNHSLISAGSIYLVKNGVSKSL